MSMKFIEGRYEIGRDSHNLILIEWVNGKDKDGNFKRQKKTSFYPTMRSILLEISEREMKRCNTIDSLICKIDELQAVIASTNFEGSKCQ